MFSIHTYKADLYTLLKLYFPHAKVDVGDDNYNVWFRDVLLLLLPNLSADVLDPHEVSKVYVDFNELSITFICRTFTLMASLDATHSLLLVDVIETVRDKYELIVLEPALITDYTAEALAEIFNMLAQYDDAKQHLYSKVARLAKMLVKVRDRLGVRHISLTYDVTPFHCDYDDYRFLTDPQVKISLDVQGRYYIFSLIDMSHLTDITIEGVDPCILTDILPLVKRFEKYRDVLGDPTLILSPEAKVTMIYPSSRIYMQINSDMCAEYTIELYIFPDTWEEVKSGVNLEFERDPYNINMTIYIPKTSNHLRKMLKKVKTMCKIFKIPYPKLKTLNKNSS